MDGDGEDGGLEAGAVASLAFALTHKALDVFSDKIAVGFFVAAFEVGDDALVGGVVFVAVGEFDFVFIGAGAVKNLLESGVGEVANGGVDGKIVAGADDLEALEPPTVLVDAVVGADAAFGDGEVGV